MKFPDLLDIAASNLRNSRLRNLLTTAGIGVGIASLVAMMSLGVGLQELAGNRLSRSGLFNTVVVSPWSDSRQMARGGEDGEMDRPMDQAAPQGPPALLDEAARRKIAQLPQVAEALPELAFVGELRLGDKSYVEPAGGLPLSARDDEAFDTLQGRFFSGAQAPEAIVRLDLAREWNPGNPGSMIGQQMTLRYAQRQSLAPAPEKQSGPGAEDNAQEDSGSDYGFTVVRKEQPVRVVGIIDAEVYGGLRTVSHARVLLPIGLVESLNIMQPADLRGTVQNGDGRKTYPSLMARVADPSAVPGVESAIKKMGFRTYSILDAAQALQRFFAVLDLLLGIFGSMALAVASLGIVNTLVMAVLERRREIGIWKALGASDRDVKRLFFAEAGAMGLAGGVAGIAFGWAISAAINWGTAFYLHRRDLPAEIVSAVPWWLVGAAIAFSLVVSLAAGIYPAARAARLDPVQAIRYE